MYDMTIDMSSPSERSELLRAITDLRGPHRFRISRGNADRSNQQIRFYRGILIPAFRRYMLAQGEVWSTDAIHDMFGLKFLQEPKHHPITHEKIGDTVRSTSDLTKHEMSEFLELLITWMQTDFGITIKPFRQFAGEESR
jgi:hypothetical protein